MAYVNYYLTQRVKITLPNIAACGRGGDKRKSLLKAGIQFVEKPLTPTKPGVKII